MQDVVAGEAVALLEGGDVRTKRHEPSIGLARATVETRPRSRTRAATGVASARSREAGGGTRTHDLGITNALLYQLSYSGAAHSVRGRARVLGPVAPSGRKPDNRAMQPTDTTAAERILADRARYVAPGRPPRGSSSRAPRARASPTSTGARTSTSRAGSAARTRPRHPAVVDAIQEQLDRYLHQCFIVGTYEPYVDVCRRLAELSPCGDGEQRSLLVNSGAEAVENAVKIARAATGRPAVVVFDGAFHGRTLLAMTMTSKVKPYKAGFGPFAPEVYRAPAPYPYHGISSDDAIAAPRAPVQGRRRPVDGRLRRPRAGPRRGRVRHDAAATSRPGSQELCRAHGILYVDDEVQSGVGRTGTMWAIEQYEAPSPTCSSRGSRSAAACRSPA